jgi:hypothetical protein
LKCRIPPAGERDPRDSACRWKKAALAAPSSEEDKGGTETYCYERKMG